eukprot:COSAG02_NODE_4279_length_5553_cov_3.634763_3_plen_138_part_00
MGKAEGSPLITDKMPWHGHVTAVTVDPDYRRLGLADGLMHGLEEISEKTHNAFFVDLFVRVSNTVAVRAPEYFRRFTGLQVAEPNRMCFTRRSTCTRSLDTVCTVRLWAIIPVQTLRTPTICGKLCRETRRSAPQFR